MRGQAILWSPPHVEYVREWIKKYPKGATINLKQIEYAEPEKWKELLDAGHKPDAIRDKSRSILRAGTGYTSPSVKRQYKSVPLADGRYQCKLCNAIVINKQSLGSHYRYHCPGNKAQEIPQPTKPPQPQQPKSASWHFCPNCAYPLAH